MKKMLCVLVLGVLAATVAVQAADNGLGLKTTVDASIVSKYMWRGFNVLDDRAAFQPSINLALDNGINFNVWASYGLGEKSGARVSTVDATEYDYTIAYKNTFGENCWQTNYTVGWRYYDYIYQSSQLGDMQEGFIELAWPKLIGNNLTPRYGYYHMWASESGSYDTKNGGPMHDLGLDYTWTFDFAPELPMTLSGDVWYNDGTGITPGTSTRVAHDWSHYQFGLTTNMRCPLTGGKITPGVWYQHTMEQSVNDTSDEVWCGISYSLTF